jgi:hypothetical protein
MATQIGTLIIGVNVDQLIATINAIREDPELTHFQFCAKNEWIDGGHSRISIQAYYTLLHP